MSREPRAAADPGLGGEDDVVAGHHVADQRADQLLRGALAVPGGGVDQRAARLGEGDHLVARLVLVGVAAPGERAETQTGHPKPRPAEVALLHAVNTIETEPSPGPRLAGNGPPRLMCHIHPTCRFLSCSRHLGPRTVCHALPDQQEEQMDYIQAVILGIVEGLTEFLPVSSTGHLTIAEQLLGLQVDDPAVTAYTAVIQMGAILAVLFYFWRDIWRIAAAWVRGPGQARGEGPARPPDGLVRHRRLDPDRDRRLRGQGPDHRPAALAVGGRHRADPVERGDGGRRTARQPGPGREATSPCAMRSSSA